MSQSIIYAATNETKPQENIFCDSNVNSQRTLENIEKQKLNINYSQKVDLHVSLPQNHKIFGKNKFLKTYQLSPKKDLIAREALRISFSSPSLLEVRDLTKEDLQTVVILIGI